MNKFLIKHGIATAFVSSAIILIAGIYFNIATHKYIHLTPAGAMIIVVGIILGVLNLDKIVIKLFKDFVASQSSEILDEVIESEINSNHKSTKESHNNIREKITRDMDNAVDTVLNDVSKKYKLYEVYVIIIGTLVNGWGDFIFNKWL